ncbi:hypothetical protein G6F22_019418 [Rhizopus arrhizus]|nr:hypothetical protein G6F22_019418 [Rhizopus arrhizus]
MRFPSGSDARHHAPDGSAAVLATCYTLTPRLAASLRVIIVAAGVVTLSCCCSSVAHRPTGQGGIMNTAVIINLLIQLVAGAAGGNGLGKMLQQFNLGPLGNTIAGAIGGLAGGSWLAPMITAGAGAAATAGNTGLDLSTIAGDVVGGGVGGAVLTLIVGIVRKMFVGRAP